MFYHSRYQGKRWFTQRIVAAASFAKIVGSTADSQIGEFTVGAINPSLLPMYRGRSDGDTRSCRCGDRILFAFFFSRLLKRFRRRLPPPLPRGSLDIHRDSENNFAMHLLTGNYSCGQI
jgi:hypothetical protein